MAVLSVRLYGDPVLRKVAEPVAAVTADVKKVIEDMVETMWRQVGIGLAANSVSIVLLAPVALAAVHYIAVRPEEAYLTARFGEDYTRYTARVRRYL